MKEYWLAKLGGELPSLDFAADRERSNSADFQRRLHRFRLEADSVRMLEAVNRRHGVTMFMTLLAAIKVLLYRHTGQEDIITGTPIAGRVHTELEGQIGPYLNVLALRERVSGEEPFEMLLERVRDTTLDAYSNQLYPFDRLLDDLRVKRQAGRNPIFEVGFTLQNQRDAQSVTQAEHLEINALTDWDIESPNAEALTDLWFLGEQKDGALEMTLVYNGAIFLESTARRLSEDLATIIETFGRDSATRINAVRLDRAAAATATEKIMIELNLH